MLIEFTSEDFADFTDRIEQKSTKLINKIIKNHCPICVGEKVKTFGYGGEAEWLQVSTINLMIIDSWSKNNLSFFFEGRPLKKNGEPMRNRKPVWFDCFEKNGEKYTIPSYCRLTVGQAKMYQGER